MTEDQLSTPPKAQAWKVALARQVRDAQGVSTSWLARRMGFGSPSYLRKLLCPD